LKEQIENYDASPNPYTESKVKSISYRPFDNRLIYFDTELVTRHREKQIRHSFSKNISLLSGRQTKNKEVCQFFISNTLSEMKTAESSTGSYHFQLYTYPESNGQQTIEQSEERTPNLKTEIVKQIADNLGLTFTNEPIDSAQGSKAEQKRSFAPIDILDYIYAVLHSPSYREKYKEFLKIDFPRVPYPKDKDTFSQLVKLGGEIRQIHLLESPTVEQYITQYPVDGNNVISRKISKSSPGYVADNDTHGKVYINDEQYFENVPLVAWEFYIGGYQPAQKWLKDRKDRKLEFDDILHYQKIIVALSETDRIMKEIDKIEI
jgi:predicted helicase